MKFHKGVEKELQEMLSLQLKEYECRTDMTKEERRELHKWVASGRSPYDNGDYICGENGWPMDFISALRFVEEQTAWFRSLSPEEQEELLHPETVYDTESKVLVFCPPERGLTNAELVELPFQ